MASQNQLIKGHFDAAESLIQGIESKPLGYEQAMHVATLHAVMAIAYLLQGMSNASSK